MIARMTLSKILLQVHVIEGNTTENFLSNSAHTCQQVDVEPRIHAERSPDRYGIDISGCGDALPEGLSARRLVIRRIRRNGLIGMNVCWLLLIAHEFGPSAVVRNKTKSQKLNLI